MSVWTIVGFEIGLNCHFQLFSTNGESGKQFTSDDFAEDICYRQGDDGENEMGTFQRGGGGRVKWGTTVGSEGDDAGTGDNNNERGGDYIVILSIVYRPLLGANFTGKVPLPPTQLVFLTVKPLPLPLDNTTTQERPNKK